MPWLADVRKAALTACVTAVLAILVSLWNARQVIATVSSTHLSWVWWIIPASAFLFAFAAIIPAFYFALYRNHGTLNLTTNLRLLSLAAALVLGIITAAGLPGWIRSLEAYWTIMKTLEWRTGGAAVVTAARDPRTIGHLSVLLGELSNLACVLLLFALFRQAGDEPATKGPASRLLRAVKVTVVVWGCWVGVNVVRLVLTPYACVQTRNWALQIGRRPPELTSMLAESIRMLLEQACIFAAPYVVYRSLSRHVRDPGGGKAAASPLSAS